MCKQAQCLRRAHLWDHGKLDENVCLPLGCIQCEVCPAPFKPGEQRVQCAGLAWWTCVLSPQNSVTSMDPGLIGVLHTSASSAGLLYAVRSESSSVAFRWSVKNANLAGSQQLAVCLH